MMSNAAYLILCIISVFFLSCDNKENDISNDIRTLITREDFNPQKGDLVHNSIGMKLIYIPPGEFMMGSRDSVSEVLEKCDEKMREYL